MKKVTIGLGICAVLTGFAASATAAQAPGWALEQCKAQVAGHYAGASEMKLVSQRHYRDGTRMKLAVHHDDPATGYTTTRLADCWVESGNDQAYWRSASESMLAVTRGDEMQPRFDTGF